MSEIGARTLVFSCLSVIRACPSSQKLDPVRGLFSGMTDGRLALTICCHHDTMMRTTTIRANPNYICNTTISLLIKKETSIEVVRIIQDRKNNDEREEPSLWTVQNKCTTKHHATTNRVRYHNDNTLHYLHLSTYLPLGKRVGRQCQCAINSRSMFRSTPLMVRFDDCGVTVQRTSEP